MEHLYGTDNDIVQIHSMVFLVFTPSSLPIVHISFVSDMQPNHEFELVQTHL